MVTLLFTSSFFHYYLHKLFCFFFVFLLINFSHVFVGYSVTLSLRDAFPPFVSSSTSSKKRNLVALSFPFSSSLSFHPYSFFSNAPLLKNHSKFPLLTVCSPLSSTFSSFSSYTSLYFSSFLPFLFSFSASFFQNELSRKEKCSFLPFVDAPSMFVSHFQRRFLFPPSMSSFFDASGRHASPGRKKDTFCFHFQKYKKKNFFCLLFNRGKHLAVCAPSFRKFEKSLKNILYSKNAHHYNLKLGSSFHWPTSASFPSSFLLNLFSRSFSSIFFADVLPFPSSCISLCFSFPSSSFLSLSVPRLNAPIRFSCLAGLPPFSSSSSISFYLFFPRLCACPSLSFLSSPPTPYLSSLSFLPSFGHSVSRTYARKQKKKFCLHMTKHFDDIPHADEEDIAYSESPAPTWRDYLSWIPQNTTYYPPDTPPEELPLRTIKTKNNITVEYRQGCKEGLAYLDDEHFKMLENEWNKNDTMKKELARIRKEEKALRGIPDECPDDMWVPLPYVEPENEYPKSIEYNESIPGYDFVETFYDPKRNYTWSYKKYNPVKTEYGTINVTDPNSPFIDPTKCDSPELRRYYNLEMNLPEKKADNETFRQPPLEELFMKGLSNNDRESEPWDQYGQYAGGIVAPHQNFWKTLYILENKNNNPEIMYRQLGSSDIEVSEVCLGTMTFGLQADKKRAHELLDFAFEEFNVNFFDTSELYPLPAQKRTYGIAEKILGEWIHKKITKDKKKRKNFVISTKIAGRSNQLKWLRNESAINKLRKSIEGTCLSKEQIIRSVLGNLERLQCEYIDVVHFHWPDRYVPLQSSGDFCHTLYDYRCAEEDNPVPMEEQLEAIKYLLDNGKIRAWGLSNETPWGVLRFWELAQEMGIPPPCSVQLHYNLLCRNDLEKGFVELARPQNTGISILGYGPLAGGILTGKYIEYLEYPTTGRILKFPSYMKRYRGSIAARAVRQYHEVCMRHDIENLSLLAMRWCFSRPFICSTVMGANDIYQLRENLMCLNEAIGLTDNVEREVNTLHWKWRDPLRIIQ